MSYEMKKALTHYQCRPLVEENIELKKRIAELEEQIPQWISVEDRLPENNCTFLAVMNHGAIYTMRLPVLISKNELPKKSKFTRERVTHWMPLPDAIKGGDL